jgi:DNA repair protein RadA
LNGLRAGVRGETEDSVQTADDALTRDASFPFYSSGSAAIDGLLGGGFRAGRLVEVFGKSNSGKSQVAMQASLCAAENGAKALFVDTEGSFRPERVEQIAEARGWKTEGVLERIVYVRSDSASEQMEAVRKMQDRVATADCRLVIIDTLTRNFSVELPGRSNLQSRQAALNVHLSEMARDAYLHGRAYILTNRVTFGASREVGIGGKTVEQLVHESVLLQREGNSVRATAISSGGSVTAGLGLSGVL